jgi:hypothetical protein
MPEIKAVRPGADGLTRPADRFAEAAPQTGDGRTLRSYRDAARGRPS